MGPNAFAILYDSSDHIIHSGQYLYNINFKKGSLNTQ